MITTLRISELGTCTKASSHFTESTLPDPIESSGSTGVASRHRPSVLVIAPQPFFQWRGAAIRVRHTVRALAESGFRVDLLTLPFGDDVDIPEVRILRVYNPLPFIRNVPIGPSPSKAFFDLLLLFYAATLVARYRYTAVHCLEESSLIGSLLQRFCKIRFVFDKLGDLQSFKGGRLRNWFLALYRRLELYPLRHADAVLVGSPLLRSQVLRDAPRQTVCHLFDLPTNLEESDKTASGGLRDQWTRGKHTLVALYVGSFAGYQGIDLLFESIKLVLHQRPNIQFVIIGGEPSDIAQRERWLREQGIGNAVVFAGRVHPDAIPAYLAASDILLCPRQSGVNAPLKLLDYMRAERAIVATDQIGNRAILDPEIAILTPQTADGFANGIFHAAQDPILRARLARNARLKLEREFSFSEFKNRLADCYQTVLGDQVLLKASKASTETG